MYFNVQYNFRPNPSCKEEFDVHIEHGFDYKKVKYRCGQTDIMGGVSLCDACCELADKIERYDYEG